MDRRRNCYASDKDVSYPCSWSWRISERLSSCRMSWTDTRLLWWTWNPETWFHQSSEFLFWESLFLHFVVMWDGTFVRVALSSSHWKQSEILLDPSKLSQHSYIPPRNFMYLKNIYRFHHLQITDPRCLTAWKTRNVLIPTEIVQQYIPAQHVGICYVSVTKELRKSKEVWCEDLEDFNESYGEKFEQSAKKNHRAGWCSSKRSNCGTGLWKASRKPEQSTDTDGTTYERVSSPRRTDYRTGKGESENPGSHRGTKSEVVDFYKVSQPWKFRKCIKDSFIGSANFCVFDRLLLIIAIAGRWYEWSDVEVEQAFSPGLRQYVFSSGEDLIHGQLVWSPVVKLPNSRWMYKASAAAVVVSLH